MRMTKSLEPSVMQNELVGSNARNKKRRTEVRLKFALPTSVAVKSDGLSFNYAACDCNN
jgi:hypothetical protein